MALYEETKQLQAEQNAKFPGVGVPEKSFVEAFQEKAHLFKNFDYNTTPSLETTPVELDRPDSWARKLGRFYDPTLPQENFLAEQQSGWERVGYTLPRIAAKTVSEVAQLPGYLGGAVAWGIHGFEKNDIGMMVDNFWQNAIQDVEQETKDRLPVYVSDALKSGSLVKNIFSTSFWANEGADGVGFLLAFLAPGAALRGLKLGTGMAKILKPGTTFIKGLEAGAAPEEVASALAGTKFAGNINDVASTVINTLFESAAEGGQTYNTILERTGDKQKAANAAVDVLTKNFGILGISNYIDQKWLFGKANLISNYAEKNVKEAVSKSMFSRVLGEDGKLLDAVAKRTRFGNIGQVSKTITEGFLKEGFWEEGTQFAASKQAEKLESDDKGFIGELVDIGKTYVDSLTDVDMQKSIFLGGVMGSGMATIQTRREMKQEDKVLTNFHNLVKDNFIDRYRNISDLAETTTDGDGNVVPIYNEDGSYKIDTVKAQEMLSKHMVKYIQGKQLIELAKEGNVEAFEKIKNERDLNYFVPFLQVEGGLEAAISHIDNLAETDVKAMQKEGVPIDLEATKKELKDKVIGYQNIYNRIQNTHDLNMNIKYSPAEKAIFTEFSDLVKNNKMGAEATLQFSADRVNKIKQDLSNFKSIDTTSIPITSSETRYTPKMVEELKKSFEEQKSTLTPTDVLNVENMIKNIEGHVTVMEFARKKLKDLYTKTTLQKEFTSYKETKAQKTEVSTTTAVTEEKTKVADETKAKVEENRTNSLHEITPEEKAGGVDEGLQQDEKGVWSAPYYDLDGNNLGTLSGTKEEVIAQINSKYDEELYTLTPSKPISKSDPIIPEEKFKDNMQEVRGLLLQYEADAKHEFSVAAGVNNWLMSTGDQRQAIENDDIARWYNFVTKYAYQTQKDGRHKYIFRSYTFDQVGKLDVNDPIRQNLKFFVGTENKKAVLKTYDQVTDKTSKTLNDDIKLVVFDRTGQIVKTSKIGVIDDKNDQSQIISNSLPLPSTLSAKGFERFSLKAEKTRFLKAKGVTGVATKEQEAAAEKAIKPMLEVSLNDYKLLRDELKTSQSYFDITRVNPGIKLGTGGKTGNDAVDTDLLEAAGLNNINSLFKRIETPARKEGNEAYSTKVERNRSGAVHGLVNGFWYLGMDNRYELIKPKTLGETESVEDIVKLIQAYATNPKDNEDLRKYLGTILYTGVNNNTGTVSPYRLQFEYPRENGVIVGGVNSLVYGVNTITLDELVKGENLETLREFLKDKYWNFDNSQLNATEFTEYYIDKDNKIKGKTWEFADGGYKGFLFSTAENNKTKGTVWVKPRKEGFNFVTEPQYLNQSVQMTLLGNDLKTVQPQNTQSTWNNNIKPEVLGEQSNKPFIPFGQKAPVATETKPEPKTFVPFGQKSTTETKPSVETLGEPLSQPFIPFGQSKPVVENKTDNTSNVITQDQLDKTIKRFTSIGDILSVKVKDSDTFVDVTIKSVHPTTKEVEVYYKESNQSFYLTKGDEVKNWRPEKKSIEPTQKELDDMVSQRESIELSRAESGEGDISGAEDAFWKGAPGYTPNKPTIKPLTVEEYWGVIGTQKQQDYLKQTNNNLDLAKHKAHLTHLLTLEDSNLDREATAFDNYQKENLNSTKAWLKEKFPNISVEIIDGLIDGKSWGRLTKSAKILLSSIAAEGTGYHEGFHTFSQLVLANQVRKELYDEVRQRLPNQKAINEKTGDVAEYDSKNLTDEEVEEILAEEFRIYMMSPNSYSFAKNEPVKKNFFQKLFDLILNFFGITNKTAKDFQIEMVFDILKNGQFDVVAKELSMDFDRKVDRNRVEGLTDQETMLFVKDINYMFFKILFDPRADYTETALFGLDYSFNQVYKAVSDYYEAMAESKGENSFQNKISQNFDNLIKEHLRFLKQYKINIGALDNNEKEEVDEDETEDNSNYTYKDHLNINLSDLVDNQVRFLIAGLPSIVGDEKVLSTLSEYKTRSTVKFNKIMNTLNDNLTNLGTDPQEYFDKIKELIIAKPSLEKPLTELLTRLKVDDKVISGNMMLLRAQFVRSFSHHKNTPLLTNYQLDGTKNNFNAVDQEVQRLIRNTWLNQARSVIDYTKSYITRTKDSRGAIVVDTNKLQSAIKVANELKDKSREQLDAYLTILKGLGITIANNFSDVYNYQIVKDYLTRLTDDISASKNKELLLSDLFNPDVVQNQKETKALINYTQKFLVNDTDLSFYNQDGNREYSINLNSHTTDTINLLNKISYNTETGEWSYPEGIEHLLPYNGSIGNLFNRNSVWGEHLMTNGKIKVVDLKGLVDQFNSKNSTEISKATFGDYKSITFNALLNGISIHLRSADRKRELGFMMTDEDGNQSKINYNITQDQFKKRMLGYLKDELATSFALLIDPDNWGGDLLNYSENAKQLRAFNFLYDGELNSEGIPILSIETFAENSVAIEDTRDTITRVDELVTLYTTQYTDYIDKSFDRFISKMNTLTEESLKEDSVIIENFTKDNKSMGIYAPGLNTESLSNFNITPMAGVGIISRKDLDKLILFANYTQFIGSQEQLKFIMGDMAMWSDTTDFHKRVNGATSPKNKLTDSVTFRQQMSDNFDRLDSKERTDSLDIVVINDIISSNKDLAKKFTEYNKIKGTDAQSWATLDEYRDVMLRNGTWYDAQEKTYQWEQQKLVLRLLELKKNKSKLPFLKQVNKQMFTDPNGVFYKHTNGVVPTTPMFKGRELTESELGVLTIQKPQGFGPIKNFKGLNAIQFFKTSTAPIFPSELTDDNKMFESLLSMMAKGQGIITFNSAMKGTVIGSQTLTDKKGNIPSNGYISQQLAYNDFGLQLDISDEEKKEVTISTQRTRLEFIDVFSNGQLVKNENLAKLRDEYVKITNEILDTERQLLINELGLKWNSTKGNFELVEGKESKEKFKKRLIKAFDFALMPYNIIDGLNLALDSAEKVFDVTVSKFKIEEILSAMVRRDLIGRKTKGDMLVQESSQLYDPSLKFYRLENGVVIPMEIMISLPTELIPVVDRLGGLDKLNEAIAKHDTKLLGEDFFKMLDIPMNRIPGQSLSSLDIGRVKKFLSHSHGAKVILSPEITTKASSDFDVDKMTSYFSYIGIEEGKVKYYTDLNKLEGKKNRLNEIAKEALLDPERFDELTHPLTSKNVKKLTLDSERKLSKTAVETEAYETSSRRNNKWENIPTWWYNMQKGYEFFRSKTGIAMAAVHLSANALVQIHPMRMNSVVPLFFAKQMYTKQENDKLGNPIETIDQSQYYHTGFMYDSDDYMTSRNFAEFGSAFVDVVKDPFIFDLTDNYTFNTLAFLNRYGVKSGVGLESVISFMTQNSIKDYLRVRRANTPKFLSVNQYHNELKPSFKLKLNFDEQYNKTFEIIKERLKGTDTNLPIDYKDTVASSLQQLLTIPEGSPRHLEILNEIKEKTLKYGYRGFTSKELHSADIRTNFKDQIQILDNFLMYQILGQNLVQLNLQLRPDARGSMARHISAIEANHLVPTEDILNKGLFVQEDIEAMIGTEKNKTLLTEFYKTQTSMKVMFGWTSLIHKDPIISEFFESVIYRTFANPNKWKTKKEVDRTITDIESDFLTFIMADSLGAKDYIEQQNIYKYLFTDNNSVPERLLQLKKTVQGNIAINELEPLIAQRLTKSRTLSETDNISLFNRNFDVHELDAIESNLYDLGIEANPANQKFIYDLMYHSVFQSGFHNAANSYLSVIPNRLFIDIAEKSVIKFLTMSDEAKTKKLNSFYEQLHRNNAYNTRIVPRHPWPTKKSKYQNWGFAPVYVDGNKDPKQGKLRKPFYTKYDYIAFNYNTHDPRPFKKLGVKPPKGVVLYQRVSEDTFIPVSKLGDGQRLREFYPMIEAGALDRTSILESNVYTIQQTDMPYTESTGNNNPLTDLYGFDEDLENDDLPFGDNISAFDASMIGRYAEDSFIADGQFNSYFKVLKESSTVQQALGMVERNSSNPAFRELAKVLKTVIRPQAPLIISRAKFEKVNNLNMENGLPQSIGLHYTETGRTYIYEKLTDTAFEEILLHESLHVLANREYDKDNSEFAKKINRIREHARTLLTHPNSSQYAKDIAISYSIPLNDGREFLQYALTNSDFQAALAQLPSENPEVTKGKLQQGSVFKEFLDTLLGLITKYFNQIFGTSQPQYAEQLKGITSVVHDLIALVQEDLIDKVESTDVIKSTTDLTTNLEKKIINQNELNKEVSKSFEDLYPDYDYLNSIEQEAFLTAVSQGEIELNCGL